MKSLGISVAAILLLVQLSSAQVRLGISGGVNFSGADQRNLYYSPAYSTTGYAVGGIIDWQVSKNVSFLIEPTYIEKGTYADPFSFGGIVPRVSFELSYFELPVLLKYSVGKDLRPYIVAGPSFGINLSSNVGAEIRGPWFGQLEVMAGASDIVQTFECSMEFGGGLSYQVDDILELFFEARYVHSITNTMKDGRLAVSIADEMIGAEIGNAAYRNKGFIVMFGFTLPL